MTWDPPKKYIASKQGQRSKIIIANDAQRHNETLYLYLNGYVVAAFPEYEGWTVNVYE